MLQPGVPGEGQDQLRPLRNPWSDGVRSTGLDPDHIPEVYLVVLHPCDLPYPHRPARLRPVPPLLTPGGAGAHLVVIKSPGSYAHHQGVALSETGLAVFCFLLRLDVMAEHQAHRPEKPQHPDRLWVWEKNVYLDEFRRSWLPIIPKVPTNRLGASRLGSRDVSCLGLGALAAGDQGTEDPLCLNQED